MGAFFPSSARLSAAAFSAAALSAANFSAVARSAAAWLAAVRAASRSSALALAAASTSAWCRVASWRSSVGRVGGRAVLGRRGAGWGRATGTGGGTAAGVAGLAGAARVASAAWVRAGGVERVRVSLQVLHFSLPSTDSSGPLNAMLVPVCTPLRRSRQGLPDASLRRPMASRLAWPERWMVPLWVSMIRVVSRRAVMAPMETVTGRGAVNAGLPGRPDGSTCSLQASVPCHTPSRSLI